MEQSAAFSKAALPDIQISLYFISTRQCKERGKPGEKASKKEMGERKELFVIFHDLRSVILHALFLSYRHTHTIMLATLIANKPLSVSVPEVSGICCITLVTFRVSSGTSDFKTWVHILSLAHQAQDLAC